MYVYIYIYIYIYNYVRMYVCIYIYIERERDRDIRSSVVRPFTTMNLNARYNRAMMLLCQTHFTKSWLFAGEGFFVHMWFLEQFCYR